MEGFLRNGWPVCGPGLPIAVGVSVRALSDDGYAAPLAEGAAMTTESQTPAPGDGAKVVVVGASFGGVDALLQLVRALPPDFPAVLGLVLHVGAQPSILPELLGRAGALRAVHPGDGEMLAPGTAYVAPPDHHLLFSNGRAHLSRGPRENHARPAIDPLFRSAALGWGPRAIGIILTGHMDDGTAGLAAIKACGGIAIVQNPGEADAPGMPTSALANVEVDHCLPLAAIAPLLLRLVQLPSREGIGPPPAVLLQEQAILTGESTMEDVRKLGEPSQLTCPDCGGTLSEVRDKPPLRFRCHTGHAYTVQSLRGAQIEQTAHALQSTLRALKEREALLRRLAVVSKQIGDTDQARAGLQEAERVHRQAEDLSRIIEAEPGGA
jgi:two-component system chemotaxis response regulator CheB